MRRTRLAEGFFCLLLCVLLLLLSSCSLHQKSPDRILSELMEAIGELPVGESYCSRAEEGTEGYLPSAVLRAMYGETAEPLLRTSVFSIYLSSFAEPYELAVFLANSYTDARAVYTLLLGRADDVRVALRHTGFEFLGEEITVLRSGRYVVMGITKDEAELRRAIKKVLP